MDRRPQPTARVNGSQGMTQRSIIRRSGELSLSQCHLVVCPPSRFFRGPTTEFSRIHRPPCSVSWTGCRHFATSANHCGQTESPGHQPDNAGRLWDGHIHKNLASIPDEIVPHV